MRPRKATMQFDSRYRRIDLATGYSRRMSARYGQKTCYGDQRRWHTGQTLTLVPFTGRFLLRVAVLTMLRRSLPERLHGDVPIGGTDGLALSRRACAASRWRRQPRRVGAGATLWGPRH